MNDLEDLAKRLQGRPKELRDAKAVSKTNLTLSEQQQLLAKQQDEISRLAVRDKKVQLEIAKLVEFNDVFGVQQRFQKIADIIGNPIKKDTVTTNHSIDSATVHLQFAFTYKTWKGRPLVTVVDNVSYPGTGMSQGGGVSSHKEAGRPEMLSDSLLVTLHHYDDPNYESYGINLANNHWVHANIYYEYKHLKNAYKLEESGVDNLVFYPNPTQYSLPTDPEQFKTNLNEAYVKLHDSYLLQTG